MPKDTEADFGKTGENFCGRVYLFQSKHCEIIAVKPYK
jgi:hypothetical protein